MSAITWARAGIAGRGEITRQALRAARRTLVTWARALIR